MSTIEILLYAIAAVALLSLFVTIQVACSQDSAPMQKAMQIAIVWLLPIVGALFVYLFRRADAQPRGPDGPDISGSDGMPGGVQ